MIGTRGRRITAAAALAAALTAAGSPAMAASPRLGPAAERAEGQAPALELLRGAWGWVVGLWGEGAGSDQGAEVDPNGWTEGDRGWEVDPDG